MAVSDFDIQEYLNHINLKEGTVDYNVMQQLLLIDQELFVQILDLLVTDYRNGIQISDTTSVFRRIANLPHINNTTVKYLKDQIVDNTSIKRVKHHFIETGSPLLGQTGFPILDLYKEDVLIPFIEFANRKYQDYRSFQIKPNITDLTRSTSSSYYEFQSVAELMNHYEIIVTSHPSTSRKLKELYVIAGGDFKDLLIAVEDFTNKLQFIDTSLQNQNYFLNNNFIGTILRKTYTSDFLSPKFIEQAKVDIVNGSVQNDYRQFDGLDKVLNTVQNNWNRNPSQIDIDQSVLRIAAYRNFWPVYFKTKFGYTSPFWQNNDVLFYEKFVEFCKVTDEYLTALRDIQFELVKFGP